ncbi:MAG TPA: deoxyguanosinetriphosphate triphosphohydrolase, partial [Thermodesulfobacteriota bacterium]
NHDVDDAIRAGIITIDDVPKECINVLGKTNSERINKMVTDIIFETKKISEKKVIMSKEVEEAIIGLRGYLFNTVYMNERIRKNFLKASKLMKELYEYLCSNPEEFWKFYGKNHEKREPTDRAVCDFIAGMTDSYAISIYEKIFLPKRWHGDLSSF